MPYRDRLGSTALAVYQRSERKAVARFQPSLETGMLRGKISHPGERFAIALYDAELADSMISPSRKRLERH
jgi:hypothetical protein